MPEAALRWREEEGRIERLERLGAIWRRNQGLRELVAAVKTAAGEAEPGSELGEWLSWAQTYANRSDPLNRFRNRKGGVLTLYYSGYDHNRIAEQSFREPEPVSYGTEKTKSGIELTDRPPRLTSYERTLKIELPGDLVLPFEWPQESDHYWRVFRPGGDANRVLRFGAGPGRRAFLV